VESVKHKGIPNYSAVGNVEERDRHSRYSAAGNEKDREVKDKGIS
jgi:hypothetical protein